MADVQTKKGFYRIANRLAEAILLAPFTLTQQKAVGAIIRLSWGWRKYNVQMSLPELAERCGLTFSGGFRRDFAKLVEEGVIVEVAPGHGQTPATYAINKNFEQWGRYTIGEALLERIFGKRPAFIDIKPPRRRTTDAPPAFDSPPPSGPTNPVSASPPRPEPETPEKISAPPLSTLSASVETALRLHGDGVTPSNPPAHNELHGRKNIERQERQTTTAIPRARELPKLTDDSAQAHYARSIYVATNEAIIARFGEQTRMPNLASAQSTAAVLTEHGVPLEFAANFIAARIAEMPRSDRPPYSVRFFQEAILAAHEEASIAIDRRGNGRPKAGPEPVAATVARVVDPEAAAREEALRAQYARERLAASAAWGKDPANAEAYRALLEKANGRFGAILDSKRGLQARDADVVLGCLQACGFPDFETWRAVELVSAPPNALPDPSTQ